MVYRGRVENGLVVLDQPTGLPDGVTVEVRVVEPHSTPSAMPARPWLRFSGAVKDLPPDASTTIDQVLYGHPEP